MMEYIHLFCPLSSEMKSLIRFKLFFFSVSYDFEASEIYCCSCRCCGSIFNSSHDSDIIYIDYDRSLIIQYSFMDVDKLPMIRII